jgi:hypothetical protein
VKKVEPRWFYATDVPNTKPYDSTYKLTKRPTKFLPFTKSDSIRLENAYKKYKLNDDKSEQFVNVNEDGLFNVNISEKILNPTYWIGPSYEVRRGIWFLDNNQPIPDLLSDEIEKYYEKYRPDYFLNSNLKERNHKLPSIKINSEKELYQLKFEKKLNNTNWPYLEYNDLSDSCKNLHFKDENNAVLVNEDQLLPKMFIQNLKNYGTSFFGLYNIRRGYIEEINSQNEEQNKKGKSADDIKDDTKTSKIEELVEEESDIMSSPSTFFAETNKKFQNFMESDFSNESIDTNNDINRDVDHLILCVHGIGQTLSSKYSSINFAHDCNHMRKLLKTEFVKKSNTFVPLAYKDEKLNKKDLEENEKFKNCKVQVLPIVWRYNIDFGLDLIYNELGKDGLHRLPKLSDLNVDAVTPVRNLTADVLLDILLFYEPKFHEKILKSVIKSANEIYDKYLQNHPKFNGKVSLIGHSLGSSIVLDILNNQPDKVPIGKDFDNEKHLKFEVENFFSLGSPNGVFKFIKRNNIRPRKFKTRNFDNITYPKVKNYYNIFYATDLVAYRIEPLIHTSMSKIKPMNYVSIPEENLITSKIKDISDSSPSDSLTNKVVQKIVQNTAIWQDSTKTDLFTGQESVLDVSDTVKEFMFGLNRNGRVDYVLPQGMFDIDIISAVGAHIQYFDDADVADFLLRELWKPQKQKADVVGIPVKDAESAKSVEIKNAFDSEKP